MEQLLKRPVIVDCDPGEDDAVCLFMMFADEQFDILGITPVNGNKPLQNTETNALRLCELCGRENIPVLKGADKAIFKEQRTAGAVHGATGLGTVVLPDPVKKIEDEYAWDFIYRQAVAHKGQLEILAVGPLTNLAIALVKYPNLTGLIKQIVIMGGANGLGNYGTAAAEFNIWADPDAAKMVFSSGIPMVMMGLEICYKALVSPQDLERIRNAGAKIGPIAAQLIERRVKNGVANGTIGGVLCDAVSSAYMMDPTVLTCEDVHVDVETKGTLTEGKTIVTRFWTEHVSLKPNTKLGSEIDRERFIDMIVDSVAKLDCELA